MIEVEDFIIMDGMNAWQMKVLSSIFYSIQIFENDSFVVPFVVAIRLQRMFDQDSMMFAFDHKNPLINILDWLLNVDKNIEHLFLLPKPIVHFLEFCSDDLCKHEQ